MRSALDPNPRLTGSGAWNGPDLVLVDTIRRTLLHYSADGRAEAEPPGPLSKSWMDLYPIRTAVRDDGRMVVQAEANRFLVLDGTYSSLGNFSTLSRPSPSGATIAKVFAWSPVGTDIVAFADVRRPGKVRDDWLSGMVRFSTKPGSGGEGFEFFDPLDGRPEEKSRTYYRLGGYSLVTGLSGTGTAYYILVGNGTHLWKQEKGRSAPEEVVDLDEFFPAWKKSALLPLYKTPDDYALVMAAAEKSSMPTGIYGWQNPATGEKALYILSREWQGGRTQWLLSKLDPERKRLLGTVSIPSSANHLFAIPGREQWGFVELGAVLGQKDQQVKALVTVPTEKLVKALNSLLGKSGVVRDLCR